MVPNFGIGQVEGVREYLDHAFPGFCGRLGMSRMLSQQLFELAMGSLETGISVMNQSLVSGMVESFPRTRNFWNAIGDVMVSHESEFLGADNMIEALDAMDRGANVLLIQNHRSGADTMVMEIMVNRRLGCGIVPNWAYMSGHAVNLFLIPLMFTLAMRRFQIFSVKYRSAGLVGNSDQMMARQNLRAMMALKSYCAPGGRLVAFYPEGGRGEGCMKAGEPRTVCIPQIMSSASSKGLLILPTYVHEATNVLPVHRGENEYNEIFENARRGKASFIVGRPIPWEDIQPSQDAVACLARKCYNAGQTEKQAREDAYRRLMVDIMLGLVANLSPCEKEMGHYASPGMRSLIGPILERDAAYV